MNYLKRTLLAPRLFLLLTALGVGSSAVAQAPRYTPPPPPTKHTSVEIRMRFLLPPNVDFSGLGSVPFLDSYETSENLLLGTERALIFDDGFISQDYLATTLIEGSIPGSDLIPSPNTEGSAFFGYQNAEQRVESDPTALLFHRYASESPDVVFEGSGSGSLGWEINYTKFINRKRNFGVQVGFSFNGYDSRYNDSIQADLWIQEFQHNMLDGDIVPDLPDSIETDEGITLQPPYTGDPVRDEETTGNLIEWIASEESLDMLEGSASVESSADFRSSMYNFRAGPTYNLAMGKRMGLQLGAGVSAIYYSGRFSAYEILMNPGGGENPSRAMSTTEEAEWQVGGYLDANAYYMVSERISVFSGAQVQSGSNYTQFNEERQVDVDFSSQIYVHAGMGIKF